MATTIQLKRGNISTLPSLLAGEPAFVLDNKALYIGNGTTNTLIGGEGLGTVKTVLNTARTGGTNDLTRYLLSGHTPLNNTTPTAVDFRTTISVSNYQFGSNSVAFGSGTSAKGDNSFVCGFGASADGTYSFACGAGTSSANYSFSCGAGTASGTHSHAEGSGAALGQYSHAEGYQTSASGDYSHASGYQTAAGGLHAEAGGRDTNASANYGIAKGLSNTANTFASFMIGQYCKVTSGSATTFSTTQDAYTIGNGVNTSTRNNCFRVKYDGSVYGLSAFNSSGADYAEYFEWADGNTNNVDRVGLFVKLSPSSDKIEVADGTQTEEILGVVSHTGAVVGNAHSETWRDMYLRDDFGRIIYNISKDSDGFEIKTPKLNPSYDPSQEYIPRENRPEWDPIGLVGRLKVRDDGTCKVGGLCRSGKSGIATNSTSFGFKVLKRISSNVIEVLIK